jgi:hypothetical protein
VRGVSTGPLAPIVVAATTAGKVMHLGMSYRNAAFSRDNIDKLSADIQLCLQNLPHEPGPN